MEKLHTVKARQHKGVLGRVPHWALSSGLNGERCLRPTHLCGSPRRRTAGTLGLRCAVRCGTALESHCRLRAGASAVRAQISGHRKTVPTLGEKEVEEDTVDTSEWQNAEALYETTHIAGTSDINTGICVRFLTI